MAAKPTRLTQKIATQLHLQAASPETFGYTLLFFRVAINALFKNISSPSGPTQPPIQQVPGAISLGVKRRGSEANHSPPSSSEVSNAWSYTSTPPIRLHGVMLS